MNKLSIITVNLNNAAGLFLTMKSVWGNQTSDSLEQVEHIFIDGASTDNSMMVVEAYADRLSYIVSEKDTGIYNAMNKGIRQATGEYILFLNSGDQLVEEVLGEIFSKEYIEDILYGNIYLVKNGSRTRKKIYPKKIDLEFLYRDTICHQAALIRSELFSQELYNESYTLISDWAFFFKWIIFNKCTISHLDLFLTKYDIQGISSQDDCLKLLNAEKKMALESAFTSSIFSIIEEPIEKAVILSNIFRINTPKLLDNLNLQRSIRRWVKIFWFFHKK